MSTSLLTVFYETALFKIQKFIAASMDSGQAVVLTLLDLTLMVQC